MCLSSLAQAVLLHTVSVLIFPSIRCRNALSFVSQAYSNPSIRPRESSASSVGGRCFSFICVHNIGNVLAYCFAISSQALCKLCHYDVAVLKNAARIELAEGQREAAREARMAQAMALARRPYGVCHRTPTDMSLCFGTSCANAIRRCKDGLSVGAQRTPQREELWI